MYHFAFCASPHTTAPYTCAFGNRYPSPLLQFPHWAELINPIVLPLAGVLDIPRIVDYRLLRCCRAGPRLPAYAFLTDSHLPIGCRTLPLLPLAPPPPPPPIHTPPHPHPPYLGCILFTHTASPLYSYTPLLDVTHIYTHTATCPGTTHTFNAVPV